VITIPRPLLAAACLVLVASTKLFAQAPPPPAPPDPWSATASAGLALTSGNTDTNTLNLGYGFAYDPKTRNLVKSEGLFLRGKTGEELTTDRLALSGRDEYKLRDGLFTFGQLQYLQDQFKDIDYLVAPTVGLGYRLADTERTKLSVDGGVGGVWEKKPLGDVQASGALTFAEKLAHQLSASAALTESFSGLYKTDDFSDALYAFSTTLAATVTPRTQVKVEFLDTYKNLVAPTFEKNDIALIVGVVFKR
jgi:putative salt-induced outer membrane protein YdiY